MMIFFREHFSIETPSPLNNEESDREKFQRNLCGRFCTCWWGSLVAGSVAGATTSFLFHGMLDIVNR